MDVRERATYRVQTFGGLVVSGGDAPLAGAATQRKTLLLLAVLAASGPGGISREKLLGLFWPDSDETRARNALNLRCHPDAAAGKPHLRPRPASAFRRPAGKR